MTFESEELFIVAIYIKLLSTSYVVFVATLFFFFLHSQYTCNKLIESYQQVHGILFRILLQDHGIVTLTLKIKFIHINVQNLTELDREKQIYCIYLYFIGSKDKLWDSVEESAGRGEKTRWVRAAKGEAGFTAGKYRHEEGTERSPRGQWIVLVICKWRPSEKCSIFVIMGNRVIVIVYKTDNLTVENN